MRGHAGNLNTTREQGPTPWHAPPKQSPPRPTRPRPSRTPSRSRRRRAAPTPTRKEQEAARKQPLVPSDRRLAARQSRDQVAAQRDRARVGMARGEEKYLPARDKGPQKRFARDFVDARFSVGEVLLPVLVARDPHLLPARRSSRASRSSRSGWSSSWSWSPTGIWMGARISNAAGREVRRQGQGRARLRWYAFMRAIQLRPMRLPKPQVKRGQYPS